MTKQPSISFTSHASLAEAPGKRRKSLCRKNLPPNHDPFPSQKIKKGKRLPTFDLRLSTGLLQPPFVDRKVAVVGFEHEDGEAGGVEAAAVGAPAVAATVPASAVGAGLGLGGGDGLP